MRKALVVVVAAVLLALGAAVGWYLASPVWTLRQMAAAARAHDPAALSGYIDYPALRASTKAQVKSRLDARLGSDEQVGLGTLGLFVGSTLADRAIDALVTPEGMAAVFAGAETKPRAGAGAATEAVPSNAVPTDAAPLGLTAANREIVRDGLDRFRLHEKGKAGSDGDLVFERRGLGWKLARIEVPAQLFGAAPE